MQPRAGVVVRTKDRPEFLRRALADIGAQTFSEAEVVVANDGGDLKTVRDVVAASEISERVLIVDVARPGGRCAAANVGIAALTAPYIVLHDDDDLWHPEFLAKTVALLDASPADAGVMVATEILYEERRNGQWVETSRAPFWAGLTDVTFSSLLAVNRAVPISFLYRRALHDELGPYDESLEAVEDWDFYLRVTARYPVSFIGGAPLAFWTQRPSARGVEANSMFELESLHSRDDARVRDRALRDWVAENGMGLPLYLAGAERKLREDIERMLDDRVERIVREVYARHPLWRRLRRLRPGPRKPGSSA